MRVVILGFICFVTGMALGLGIGVTEPAETPPPPDWALTRHGTDAEGKWATARFEVSGRAFLIRAEPDDRGRLYIQVIPMERDDG